MKYTKVYLVRFSEVLADGSRKTLDKQLLASCPARGTAQLIAYHFRKTVYKNMLENTQNSDCLPCYKITVE